MPISTTVDATTSPTNSTPMATTEVEPVRRPTVRFVAASAALMGTLVQSVGGTTLLVDDTPSESQDMAATTLIGVDPNPESRFAKMLELTTLSGGSFAAARPAAGRMMLRAAWNS